MDKIYMNRLSFYGYHGVFPEENRLGQRFYVDLVLEGDLKPASRSDDLAKTVDYGKVHDLVKETMEGKARQLVETLSEEIAASLLAAFPVIQRCTVKVIKPDPPIPGHYDSVAVEMTRERQAQ
ncbi:MAG TPA: dihydroneopterin aldolase [Bacillales bacterium]|nr:dihydroneopterin aldolase [Bacillales bacterium]